MRTTKETHFQLLAKTPTQKSALIYFAARHPWRKIRSVHYSRRLSHWVCLVGAVSYFAKPMQIKKAAPVR